MAVVVIVTVAMSALGFVSIAYGYASSNPLPWNGYGRTTIQENSTFLLEANSETTVRILGNGTIPPRAFFFVQLYILTETPSGNPYQALFRLSYNDGVLLEETGWGMTDSLETRTETRGASNPEFYVLNDNSVDLQILRYAFLIVPPTTEERFVQLVSLAALGTVLVTLLVAAVSSGRMDKRPSGP